MANQSGHIKRMLLLAWLVCLAIPFAVFAQDTAANQNSGPDTPAVSTEELDQMLAPIALYPDSLLSQVLMASTYPLEIVLADRWVKNNPGLSSDQLDSALKEQDWDVSVKSLTFFPSVLAMMSEKVDWTSRLGDAFLAQQQDVMDSVQHLRVKAKETGNLRSTSEERVVVEKEIILIEPVDIRVVYVPVYDPIVVYGPWWYPDYPPFVYFPFGYHAAGPRVIFTAGFFAGPILFGGFYWSRHEVFVDHDSVFVVHHGFRDRHGHHDFDSHGRNSWRHEPYHRRALPYRSPVVASRFGHPDMQSTEMRRQSGRAKLAPVSREPARLKATNVSSPRETGRTAKDKRTIQRVRPQAKRETMPRSIRTANIRSDRKPKPAPARVSSKKKQNKHE